MSSKLKKAVCSGMLAGACAMLYFHRRLIIAAIKGEPMPEPSERAKKWCPPVREAEKMAVAAAVKTEPQETAPAAEEAETAVDEAAPEVNTDDETENTADTAADIECRYTVRNTNTGIKFDLKTDNGEVLATSEVYRSRAACLNGIKSVRNNAPVAAIEDQTAEEPVTCKNPKFEIYVDKAGEYRFRLKARNGQIVATGRSYETREECLGVVECIRNNADAEIDS